MSASKSTSTTNVTSDKVAAKNIASLSSSTLSMSSMKKQIFEGFGNNIGPKNVVTTSEPTNNPPESTVEVEATSTVADEEVQVLEGGPKKLDVK